MEFSAQGHGTSKKQLDAQPVSSRGSYSTNEATLNFCQPKSLFLAATEFIVHHLLYVESLCTLPDIVGDEIFKVALQTQQFDRPGSCIRGLQLFTTAYKAKVLESLTIKGRRPVLDDYYLELSLFLHLRALDVSSCNIDDNHSFLVHVGTQLCQLEKLVLANNSLTDKGIQMLTACSRMMGYGLTNLTFLDLSGNTSISDRVVVYMKCFNQLSTLNLSNCNISESGKEHIARLLHLTPCEVPMSDTVDDDVINKGWAAPLIDSWSSLTSLSYSHNRPSKSAEKFYSKKQASPKKTKTAAVKYKHLMFLRHKIPQEKPPLTTELAPIKSGVKDNVSMKCHQKSLWNRSDATESGIAGGCKRQASCFPVEVQRKKLKHQLKGFKSKMNCDESLLEFYHREKLYKKSAEHRLDSTQFQRVSIKCKRQDNPFVKVQRTEPANSGADFVDKYPIKDKRDVDSMPSKEELTSDKISENSLFFNFDEDSYSYSMVEQSQTHCVGKENEVLSGVEDERAKDMTKHSQVHKDNSQINRCQKTILRHKKKKLKIVKDSHSLNSEFSKVSEDYSCNRANQRRPNCVENQHVGRTSLLDFLD